MAPGFRLTSQVVRINSSNSKFVFNSSNEATMGTVSPLVVTLG